MEKEDLIIKWLEGELSEAELQEFKKLEEYESYQRLYEHAEFFESPVEVNKDKGFQDLKSRLDKPKTEKPFVKKIYPLLRIAAVFALILGIYFAFFNNHNTELKTLAAQTKTLELPDASEVILNAESILEYNEELWDKNREVNLQGEAYFKVAKGSTFEVQTELGNVTVLGTQFNVKQRKDYFEVKCFEGLVNVAVNGKNNKLRPGETIRLLNGELQKNNTFLTSPSWISGKSSFDSVPFEVVLREFERQYQVKILIQGFDTSKIFSGSFDHNNRSLALKSITQPFELDFEEQGDTVRIFKLNND